MDIGFNSRSETIGRRISDCLSDLLCREDSEILSDESPECSSDIESPAAIFDDESISIAELIEDERNFVVPGIDYLARFESDRSLDLSARESSVKWMLKVQGYYGFQPLTTYLAVNYMDRFLYLRSLPNATGWPMQLLSVGCLSLAAKMEEPLVPSLVDLQVEGARFIFESRTIQRMELLVLNALNWRLRSITPFNFLGLFAYKLDRTGTYTGFLISRADEIITSMIKEASFLEYMPSCIAAAAILCAANEIPFLFVVNPELAESWCDGLSKEKIIGCCELMQSAATIMDSLIRRPSKVLPQIRVTTRSSLKFSTDSLSSSSSSSSPYKRRKLDNCLWIDDAKENSE